MLRRAIICRGWWQRLRRQWVAGRPVSQQELAVQQMGPLNSLLEDEPVLQVILAAGP